MGRLVGYKRADLVIEAFAGLPHRLVVVGDGPLAPHLDPMASPDVTFRRSVTDDELRDLYRSARALVYHSQAAAGLDEPGARASAERFSRERFRTGFAARSRT